MTPPLTWSWDPVVLAGLAAALAVYALRWRRVRRVEGSRAAPAWRLASFVAGLAMIFAALVTPIDGLGERIFAAHMLQHVLLLDLAPILVLLGFTRVLLRPATRRLHRIEQAAGPFAHPAFAIAAYAGGMAVWHIPALYDAALRSEAMHVLEHATFISIGFLYWWHVLAPIPSRQRLHGMGPVTYMTSTKVLLGFLGVVLTFSPTLLYDAYASEPDWFGMSPQAGQAVGGALMALEQSIVMVAAAGWLVMRALASSEKRQRQLERLEDQAPPAVDG